MPTQTNAIFLSDTALNRLQKLVNSEEFSTIDDAASYIIVANTGHPTPLFSGSTPVDVPLPHENVPTSQDISPGTAFLAMDFET